VNPIVALPLAFAAGVLTIFSPCVLPLAPIVIASARADDPRGPVALGLGMALTFGVIGGALASFGVVIGDSAAARAVSAAIMVAIGAALLVPGIGDTIERRFGFATHAAEFLRARLQKAGLLGHAAAGATLAFAWGPCAGPVLGAALLIAADGGSRPAAVVTMTAYALGAAGALLAVGHAAGRLAAKARFARAGRTGRIALGATFALVGAAILTGVDRRIETVLVAAMPDWLTAFAASL
jgi:cytochrome c biogenesis protein CcdA